MRFVNPLNARSSICPIRHRFRNTLWRLRSPDRTKVSLGRICRLFPDKSSTWVSGSTLSGMVMRPLSVHSTVCLPPFHLQVQGDGQVPPKPPHGTNNSTATRRGRRRSAADTILTKYAIK